MRFQKTQIIQILAEGARDPDDIRPFPPAALRPGYFPAIHKCQPLPIAQPERLNITTSEIKISCIVANSEGETALRALHEAFGLGKASREIASGVSSSVAMHAGERGGPEVEFKPMVSVDPGKITSG